MPPRPPRRVLFPFVLDLLDPLSPTTRAFFGATGVYVGDRIVFILRDKDGKDADDGVWLATSVEHHESLRRELPSLRSIGVFGTGVTAWQILPATAPDFESSVNRACELVLAGDPRIGRIPASRRPKGVPRPKKIAAKKAPAKKAAKKRKG